MNKIQYTKQNGVSMVAVLLGVATLIVIAWLVIGSQASQQIDLPATTNTNESNYLKTEAELEQEAKGITGAVDAARDAASATEEATAARTDTSETPDGPATVAAGAPNPATPGSYVKYSKANLTAETNIIFFHATWCPTCRALEKNLTNNITDIPADVTIFKADYDSETELKQKYGVNRQHTLVVVDQNGTKIKTLTGLTNTLDQVLSQI